MKLIGEVFESIYLPHGEQLCLLSNPLGAAIHLRNHNLYRLDKNGDVVWQVQRNDKPGWAWFTQRRKEVERLNLSDEAGIGCCSFMSIWLQYADDSTNLIFGSIPKTALWNPGCKVFCFSTGSTTVKYELDIDTGIATTVLDQMEGRPW
jgi:hypothetical protein